MRTRIQDDSKRFVKRRPDENYFDLWLSITRHWRIAVTLELQRLTLWCMKTVYWSHSLVQLTR